MTGLRLMNELMDPATRETVLRNHTASGNGASVSTIVTVQEIPAEKRSPRVRADLPIPAVKDLDRKVRLGADLREVWGHDHPASLFGAHMGFPGALAKSFAGSDPHGAAL